MTADDSKRLAGWAAEMSKSDGPVGMIGQCIGLLLDQLAERDAEIERLRADAHEMWFKLYLTATGKTDCEGASGPKCSESANEVLRRVADYYPDRNDPID